LVDEINMISLGKDALPNVNADLLQALRLARHDEDVPADIRDTATDLNEGPLTYGFLLRQLDGLKNQGIIVAPNPVMLALCAGNADTEGRMAQQLQAQRLIAVDRQSQAEVQPKVIAPHTEFAYGKGIIHYLQAQVEQGTLAAVDLATIIGAEYAVREPYVQEALAYLLSKLVKVGGLVLIWPMNGLQPAIWQKYGWQMFDQGTKLIVFHRTE
jgi:hypothetical protein